jgi:4-hydroxybenzoate polyprenyltransferase
MTIRQHFITLFNLLWIGGCALALVFQTRLMVGLPTTPGWLDGLIFGSTVFGYYCTHPLPVYRTMAWLLAAGAMGCFLWLDRTTQWLAIGPALLWAAYYGLQRPGRSGLRTLPAAKPVVIALAWAWVTVWLPARQLLWPLFAARATFIFALALAYDLTDLAYDRRHQLTTLVNKIGEPRAYRIIYMALALATLWVGFGFLLKIVSLPVSVAIWATYLVTPFALHLILHSTAKVAWQKVAIDALMVLQAVLVWLTLR